MEYVYKFDDKGVVIGILDSSKLNSGENHKLAQTKVKDVELLINHYQKILSDFETNKGVVQSQKRKISEIDLSSNLNNLNPSDNKISVNIDGRIYSATFDEVNKNKAMKELSHKISQTTGFSSTFKAPL